MDTNSQVRNWIIIGVVVVALIAVGVWLAIRSKSAPAKDTAQVATSTAIAAGDTSDETGTAAVNADVSVAANGESVTVDDQAAGSTVLFTDLNVKSTSWVAIRDIEAKRILGAGRFEAGVTSGEVELLRATIPGKKYEALIYADDGDRLFDMHKDALVEGVSSEFSAK